MENLGLRGQRDVIILEHKQETRIQMTVVYCSEHSATTGDFSFSARASCNGVCAAQRLACTSKPKLQLLVEI